VRRRDFLISALAPGSVRPNVLVILADDLGWADVGFHGSEIRTPQLDRLAAEGLEINRFYSYPVCSPTRSALLTGRSPMRLGVAYSVIRPWSDACVPPDEHMMPETFRAAGYQTGMCGKWHLGHARAACLPHRRGFESAYGHLNGAIDYYTHERDGGLDWQRNGKSVQEEGYSTDLVAREAERFIRERDKTKPFLFYTAFNAPHAPLQAPPALIEKYASIADPRRRVFAAMVEAMDAGVGRILRTLEEEKIARDTIVFFFSDNGGPVNQGARNTPLRGAKGTTWEGGIRVPALLRWPGMVAGGRKSAQVVTVMDLFPTLAALTGLEPRNRKPLDGMNVWGHLPAGSHTPRENLFFAVESGNGVMFAAHHREWKLVRQEPRNGGEAVNSLFRIEDDPEEKHDLTARHPDVVRDLVARLARWRDLYPNGGVRLTNRAPEGWKNPRQWAEAARP
jgi:arylsulfatase A-like enzyme